MRNGGYEALLYHLLHEIDLRDFNVRAVPKTVGLLEQKIASLTIDQSWWYDVLQRGDLPSKQGDKDICKVEDLYRSYTMRTGYDRNRKGTQTKFGMFLRDAVGPNLKRTRQEFEFPPLKDCRVRFDDKIGGGIEWEEPEAKWTTGGDY